jgi:hypothetical protein
MVRALCYYPEQQSGKRISDGRRAYRIRCTRLYPQSNLCNWTWPAPGSSTIQSQPTPAMTLATRPAAPSANHQDLNPTPVNAQVHNRLGNSLRDAGDDGARSLQLRHLHCLARAYRLCWLLVSSARVWQLKPGLSAARPRVFRCHIADWHLVQVRSSRSRTTYCSRIRLEGKLNCASNSFASLCSLLGTSVRVPGQLVCRNRPPESHLPT